MTSERHNARRKPPPAPVQESPDRCCALSSRKILKIEASGIEDAAVCGSGAECDGNEEDRGAPAGPLRAAAC